MMATRKSEDVARLARRVLTELYWSNAPQKKIDQFVRIQKDAERNVRLKTGTRSLIPVLELELMKWGIKE